MIFVKQDREEGKGGERRGERNGSTIDMRRNHENRITITE